MRRPSIDVLIRATLTAVGAAIAAWKTITDTPWAGAACDRAAAVERPAREARAARQCSARGEAPTSALSRPERSRALGYTKRRKATTED